MPNVTLDDPVETSHAALVTLHDERLRAIAERRATIVAFLRSFRDEFGVQISPTVAMLREGAPESVRTVAAFGGLRDAVCVSAIVAGHALTLKWKRPRGVRYSDAFDVYPWFPSAQNDGLIVAVTSALAGMHSAGALQPQSAPALPQRSLTRGDLDDVLLRALLECWEDCFATGNDTIKNRRLFRALEMARAASRMPGGTDATFFDEGRAVALWVSAFEILAHDGREVGVKRVLSLLSEVQWLTPKKKSKPVQPNIAGTIYKQLYIARSEFLHGNPVTAKRLRLDKCQKPTLWFAAPLFRLALTAFLDLHFSETLPDTADARGWGQHIDRRITFDAFQRLAEDAILMADDAPDRTPPAG